MAVVIPECFARPGRPDIFGLYRDLLYLIVTDSRTVIPTNFSDLLWVRACYTPGHLIVVRWSLDSPPNLQVSFVWAFDVCFRKGHCRLVQMPNYIVFAKTGIAVAVNSLLTARKGFEGDQINIFPYFEIFKQWKTWKGSLAVPLRHVRPRQLQSFYLGYILETITRPHNLTFNTTLFHGGKPPLDEKCDEGVIDMGVSTALCCREKMS